MKKSYFIVIVLAVFLLLLLVGFVGMWYIERSNPDQGEQETSGANENCEHSLTAVGAKDSSCLEIGNISYWRCSSCQKHFLDENANIEIPMAQTIILAKGHTSVIDEAVAPTYDTTGLTEGSHCSVCCAVLVAQEEVPVLPPECYSITYSNLEGAPSPTLTQYASHLGVKNTEMPVPERLGYIFLGWYTQLNDGTQITEIPADSKENYTLYARWEISVYNIIYDMDNATNPASNPTSYTYIDTFTLAEPWRSGYHFLGWTYEGQDTPIKSVTIALGSTGDKIFTANWQVFDELADFEFTWKSGFMITGVVDKTKTSYVIPNSVTSIGEYAFEGCSELTNIIIPDNVTSIGYGAFSKCSSLTSITIPFIYGKSYDCYFGYIFGIGSRLDQGYFLPDSLKNVIITGSSIPANAFFSCKKITSITIGNDVTSIGESAFEGCSGLTSFTIPDSVTSIGSSAFKGCSGLTSITIPNSVASIGEYAFEGCSELTNIIIPDNVTSIGYGVFSKCSSLTSITVPFVGSSYYGQSYEHFGSVFGGISYAENNSYIPSYLKTVIITGGDSIGHYAFYGCSSLINIVIPNSVKSIGNNAFFDCRSLTNIVIPDSVKSIGYSAFGRCSGLTNIVIPNSVTSIASSAFSGCSGLTSITIPNSVTSIGDKAFYGCSMLTNIVIPNSVSRIGSGAFSGCNNLESITLPFVGDSIKTSVDTYQYPFGYIFGTEKYEGSIEVSQCYYGIGTSSTTSKVYYIPQSLQSVTITGGNILLGAFYGCSTLTSIVIPDSVTGIGGSAFYDCSGLTSIAIPNSVTAIGNSAFFGCSGVTNIVIPNSVKSIGDKAFFGCRGLTNVVIPNSVKSIGVGVFSGCINLKSITLPFVGDSIKTSTDEYQYPLGYVFGTEKYEGSIETTQYYYGSSTGTATSRVYYIPQNLQSVTITGGNILYGAFYNCSGLTSITINDSVTSIERHALYNCSSLTSINFDGTVAQLNAIRISKNWVYNVPVKYVICSDGTVVLS